MFSKVDCVSRRWDARALSWATIALVTITLQTVAEPFAIEQIADDSLVNRTPIISQAGLVAWYAYEEKESGEAGADIHVYSKGQRRNLTKGNTTVLSSDVHPQVQGEHVVWATTFNNSEAEGDLTWRIKEVARAEGQPVELNANYVPRCEQDGAGGNIGKQWFDGPITNADEDVEFPETGRYSSGENEIAIWMGGNDIRRITQDHRNDLAPDFWGDLIAWQKAKGWPFGWEIMMWDDGVRNQLTTNFFYDMAPKVYKRQIVWYGWDGQDFEIFLYDRDEDTTTQLTDNSFDDVSPVLSDGVVVWEGYPAVEADIFMWKDGEVSKLSNNIEDDVNPSIWGNQIVWQSFDGEDFEIYLFDGEDSIPITDNEYDDLNPDIGEGAITWMGYHENWDSEIFAKIPSQAQPVMLTDNDYEDRDPRTANGRIVWSAVDEGRTMIFLAAPK